MNQRFTFKSAALCSLLLFTNACTNDINQPATMADSSVDNSVDSSAESKKTKSGLSTAKPGTSFRFSHDYDGKTEAGEQELITISLNSHRSSGQLTVSLHAEEGIEIMSHNQPVVFDLAQGSTPNLALELVAHQTGRYYVYVQLTEKSETGAQSVSNHGIAIQVGDQGNSRSMKSNGKIQQGAKGENLMVMPATEEIN